MGSAGASYLWNEATFSATVLYGRGLRSDFANTERLPSYWQVTWARSDPSPYR